MTGKIGPPCEARGVGATGNPYRPRPQAGLAFCGSTPGEPDVVDNRCRQRRLLRGMRTFYPRGRAGLLLSPVDAEVLLAHPCISAVLYPGLSRHPGQAVAARQMIGGYGGHIEHRVRGGAAAARVEVWKRDLGRPPRRPLGRAKQSAAAGQDLPAKMAARRASNLPSITNI